MTTQALFKWRHFEAEIILLWILATLSKRKSRVNAVLEEIQKTGVVAIVRLEHYDQAVEIAEALGAGESQQSSSP